MKNILILERKDYSDRALQFYKKLGQFYFFEDLTAVQKKKILSTITILVVRLKHEINKVWLDKMPGLEIIVSPTTCLNHIDLAEADKRKIRMISLKGHTDFLKNITSTAEEAFALLLALIRNIPWAFDDVKSGRWDRDVWKGHQLSGKTLGLLGCGRLGKIMAKYGQAFGMKVIGADPNVDVSALLKDGIKKVTIAELFKQADVVSVHVNLEEDTRELVNEKLFSLMKRDAYFINTSRGEIIDEKALLHVLKNKKIAGAALDVMENEVEGKHLNNNPLIEYAKKHKNLIVVPHIGGATYEAMHITEEYVADLVLKHYQYGK